ncbi:P2 family phage major capsid protein [Pseudomonas aeruginosa]|uniref:P2 family phage major capsid protein n=1 Tax=Pseudomonas aeruginosa TaxID=287 RepID=UPI003EE1AAF8
MSNSIAVQQGLDRIMIGFNGTSAAVTTDLATNPLLQDVNIGWLQKMRTSAPDRVIEEGEDGSGKVTIGTTGDYKTLDALVFDAIQLLDPWHRKRKDLVVIVDPALLHEKHRSRPGRRKSSSRRADHPGCAACQSRTPASRRPSPWQPVP